MKVKKLLTLLILSGVLAACAVGVKPSSSSDAGNSSQQQSSQSSASNESSESKADSSDSSVDSSSSSADSSSSSSSSQQQGPTLASISLAGPTKTDYLIGEELDLTGLVVTAVYSDETSNPVAEGYEVSEVDMDTVGPKTVTVTYEGKTATFTINVAKPTAWSAEVIAACEENLHGYVPTFFYGPDLGLGDLVWQTQSGYVFAFGDALEAAGEGEDSPLKPVADILIADGFVAVAEPDPENQKYSYTLMKEVVVEEATRYVQAKIATTNAKGAFVAAGDFYLELCDPYYYSWADTGLEATLKAYFETEDDIPDLPAGALYSKYDLSNYTAMYLQYQMPSVPVFVLCSGEYALGVAAAFQNANPAWFVFGNEEEGFTAISPSENLRIDGSYSVKNGELTLVFSEPDELPENVSYVAGLINVSGYQFDVTDSGIYYYQDKAELKGEEKSLADLFARFEGLLTANNALEQKGTKDVKEDDISASYYNFEKAIKVVLEVEEETDAESGEKSYEVEVVVLDYEEVPANVKAIAAAMDIDEFDLTNGTYGWFYQDTSLAKDASDEDMQNAILGYAVGLMTAAELEMEALEQEPESDGQGGWYIEFANQSKKVELWCFKNTNENKEVTSIILQVEISDYEVPQSALKDALATALGITFKWSNTDQDFWYNGHISLEEGQTYKSIVNSFENALVGIEEEAEELTHTEAGSYYVSTWYCQEGAFDFQCWVYDPGEDGEVGTADDDIVTLVRFYLFDQNLPLMINVIALELGAKAQVAEGQYYCLVDTWYFYGSPYYTAGFTAAMMANYGSMIFDSVAGQLSGFNVSVPVAADPETNVYSATYFNETTGYTIYMYMPYDAKGQTTGVVAVIIPPQAPAAGGEGE